MIRVISGAQIGTDIAALRAAKAVGLPTGGWMTRDWRTLEGPHPDWAETYGMSAMSTPYYRARTWQNVKDSDATLRIADNFNSSGERCTLGAIQHYQRPYHDVALTLTLSGMEPPESVAQWILDNVQGSLNVAGNGRRNIEARVEMYLRRVFAIVAERSS